MQEDLFHSIFGSCGDFFSSNRCCSVIDEWVLSNSHDNVLFRKCLHLRSNSSTLKSNSVENVNDPNNYIGGIGKYFEDKLKYSNSVGIAHLSNEVTVCDIPLPNLFNIGDKYRFFVHDRVARSLRTRNLTFDFVNKVILEKLIEGALVREEYQYQKKVGPDIFEMRLDNKARVLYMRSDSFFLLLYLIWDHKLSIPIAAAQREVSALKSWLHQIGHNEAHPFVCIDLVSGRLRPIYELIPQIQSSSSVFQPSLLNIVLSPQQQRATCSSGLELKDLQIEHKTHIDLTFIQGSAGSGKTTCLLRIAIQEYRHGHSVVVIALTRPLKSSMIDELLRCDEASLASPNLSVIALEDIQDEIFGNLLALSMFDRHKIINDYDIEQWINEEFVETFSKLSKSEKAAFVATIGSHENPYDIGSDLCVFFGTVYQKYVEWKSASYFFDTLDAWHESFKALKSKELKPFKHDVDMMIIDEGQLFSSSNYSALLLYFNNIRSIIVGMDSKQIINMVGYSGRKDIFRATSTTLGPCLIRERKHLLSTNFRLPMKLISLSNSLIMIIRDNFPKRFDEYLLDVGYDHRATLSTTSSVDLDDKYSDVDIETYPVMIVYGQASHRIKELIRKRIDLDRKSFLAMRFAAKSTTSNENMNDVLSMLPTISFDQCSGLEISLPVVIDNLLTHYLQSLCPRGIFSKVDRKKSLSSIEANLLRMGLSNIYTVIARCRGPMLWLEDSDMTNHPCIKWILEKQKQNGLEIECIGDSSLISNETIDRVVGWFQNDLEEADQAWEESVKSLFVSIRDSISKLSNVIKGNRVLRSTILSVTSLTSIEEKTNLDAKLDALITALQCSPHQNYEALIACFSSLRHVFDFVSVEKCLSFDSLIKCVKSSTCFPLLSSSFVNMMFSTVRWDSLRNQALQFLSCVDCIQFSRNITLKPFYYFHVPSSLNGDGNMSSYLWVIFSFVSTSSKHVECDCAVLDPKICFVLAKNCVYSAKSNTLLLDENCGYFTLTSLLSSHWTISVSQLQKKALFLEECVRLDDESRQYFSATNSLGKLLWLKELQLSPGEFCRRNCWGLYAESGPIVDFSLPRFTQYCCRMEYDRLVEVYPLGTALWLPHLSLLEPDFGGCLERYGCSPTLLCDVKIRGELNLGEKIVFVPLLAQYQPWMAVLTVLGSFADNDLQIQLCKKEIEQRIIRRIMCNIAS